MDETETQSRFLLDLYRGASEQPAEHFQDWALERLSRDVPFDSALWCSASAAPAGPLGLVAHLHKQPTQMLVEYEAIKHLDTLHTESAQNPGKTLRVVARASLPHGTHAYLGRWGLEHVLTTLEHEPEISAFAIVSLYRASRDHPFSQAEARFKQNIFPHLVEANSRNKLAHLSSQAQQGPAAHWHSAAVDTMGLVRHAETGFKALAAREWPLWRGPQLPDALRDLTALGVGSVAPPYSPEHLSRMAGNAVMFQCSVARLARLADMTLVQLRERHAFDDLPERMRQVARLAAAGHGNKRIGSMLNISPNTVRNHLSEAYERLAIKNKTELAALLLRFEEPILEAGIG